MRSPPVIYEEILDPLAQENLAYSHVKQLQAPLELRGAIYEEPEDINRPPHSGEHCLWTCAISLAPSGIQ